MGRNTSISLGDHFEDFVDDKIATGRFKNASEVIRAGLRLLEEEEIQKLVAGLAQRANAKFVEATVKTPRKSLKNVSVNDL